MSVPSPDILRRSQWTTAVDGNTRKTTSSTKAELGPMVKDGTYVLRSDVDAFFLQGATGVNPTTSTGLPIFAKEGVRVYCTDATANGYVAVILAASTGVAWLMRIE